MEIIETHAVISSYSCRNDCSNDCSRDCSNDCIDQHECSDGWVYF